MSIQKEVKSNAIERLKSIVTAARSFDSVSTKDLKDLSKILEVKLNADLVKASNGFFKAIGGNEPKWVYAFHLPEKAIVEYQAGWLKIPGDLDFKTIKQAFKQAFPQAQFLELDDKTFGPRLVCYSTKGRKSDLSRRENGPGLLFNYYSSSGHYGARMAFQKPTLSIGDLWENPPVKGNPRCQKVVQYMKSKGIDIFYAGKDPHGDGYVYMFPLRSKQDFEKCSKELTRMYGEPKGDDAFKSWLHPTSGGFNLHKGVQQGVPRDAFGYLNIEM